MAAIGPVLQGLVTVVGAAGYVQLVGGGILWIRFHDAGFPALRLVADMPRDYVFTLGAAALLVPIAVGFGAALVQYAISPENAKGDRPRGFNLVLGVLVVVEWVAVLEVLTIKGDGWRLLLAVAAPLLAVLIARIADSTSGFRYLTLLFFVAGALYGGLVALVVERSRGTRLDLAVAVRTGQKSAVAGLLVSRSPDTIFIAKEAVLDPGEWQIVDLKRDEVAKLEFGPRGQPVNHASVRKARAYAQLALTGQDDVRPCRSQQVEPVRSIARISGTRVIRMRVCANRRGSLDIDIIARGRTARRLRLGRDRLVATGTKRVVRPGLPVVIKAELTPAARRRIGELRTARLAAEITLIDRLDRINRSTSRIRVGN